MLPRALSAPTTLVGALHIPAVRPGASRQQLVLALFLASGAAGLIYQTVWSRELVLLFGNTSQAVSTIVTAFMAGLGFGALAGAWVVARSRNPLRVYGLLELSIAVLALVAPNAFPLFGVVYAGIYGHSTPFELGMARFGFSMIAITPVTFLMGMTLPVLTRFTVRGLSDAGHRLGQLYAANTVGAVIGTLVAAFFLVELLGLTGAAYVAVLLNMIAAAVALTLSRHHRDAPRSEVSSRPSSERGRVVILAASFVAGFIALALEVLWNRLFAEGIGGTIYLYAVILAIYLAGIASGSTLFSRVGSAARDTLSTLGACLAGIGFFAVLTVVVGSGLAGPVPLGIRLVIILPATVLMGYAFPLSARLLTGSAERAPDSIARLYAANTAGSVLGAWGGVFVLAPVLGTNGALLILAAAGCLLGAVLVFADRRPSPSRVNPGLAPVAIALITLAGLGLQVPLTRTATQNSLLATGVNDHHSEDHVATVDAVSGAPIDRRLFVGGVGITAHTVDTKLIAYLPMVARPQARDLLVIGFGMGSTYRTGLILGLRTDVVELSPAVASDMGVFYPDAARFMKDPNGRVIVSDGRNFVHLTDRRYDLIVADPPPPIESAGTVLFFSREFLEQGKARLAPGGLLQVFTPYGGTLDDFRDHARTFRASFRHVAMVMSPGHYGVFMIGSDTPIEFDAGRLELVLGSASALRDFSDAPDDPRLDGAAWARLVQSRIWLYDSQVDRFAAGGHVITDDRPSTEYYLLRWALSADKRPVDEARLRELGLAPITAR